MGGGLSINQKRHRKVKRPGTRDHYICQWPLQCLSMLSVGVERWGIVDNEPVFEATNNHRPLHTSGSVGCLDRAFGREVCHLFSIQCLHSSICFLGYEVCRAWYVRDLEWALTVRDKGSGKVQAPGFRTFLKTCITMSIKYQSKKSNVSPSSHHSGVVVLELKII